MAGSPSGSAIPGILQARTLEQVAHAPVPPFVFSYFFLNPIASNIPVLCNLLIFNHLFNNSFLAFMCQAMPWWSLYSIKGGCCSVFKSCLTLCDCMDCSLPCFPVLHCLSDFAQTHVHWASDAIQPSHPLSSLLLLPSIFPSIRSFSVSRLFISGRQSLGASASVLPMNIQGWFPIGLTGWISLQSKGL